MIKKLMNTNKNINLVYSGRLRFHSLYFFLFLIPLVYFTVSWNNSNLIRVMLSKLNEGEVPGIITTKSIQMLPFRLYLFQ